MKSSEQADFKTDLTFWIWPNRSWDIAKKQTVKFLLWTQCIYNIISNFHIYYFLIEFIYDNRSWAPVFQNTATKSNILILLHFVMPFTVSNRHHSQHLCSSANLVMVMCNKCTEYENTFDLIMDQLDIKT